MQNAFFLCDAYPYELASFCIDDDPAIISLLAYTDMTHKQRKT